MPDNKRVHVDCLSGVVHTAMASGFVHDVFTLAAQGCTHCSVHRRKDAPARDAPGLAHRRFRHRWYQSYGTLWDLDNPSPNLVRIRIQRVGAALGPIKAEEYMASLGHDHLDRVWDYPGLPRDERWFVRKYWESFCVCLILYPILLKSWGGVDVSLGRVQRLVDGQEIWEEEPGVPVEYERLLRRARFLAKRDSGVKYMLERYGQVALRAV